MPIVPFVYILLDTPAQYVITRASARGTYLVTDVISSPINTPNSPDFPKSNRPTTNHTGALRQKSAILNSTVTQLTTQTDNNNNTKEDFYHGQGPHLTTDLNTNPEGRAPRFSDAQDLQLTTCVHHMSEIPHTTNRGNFMPADRNSPIVPGSHSTSVKAINSNTAETTQQSIEANPAAIAISPVPSTTTHCCPFPGSPRNRHTTANRNAGYNPAPINKKTYQNTMTVNAFLDCVTS